MGPAGHVNHLGQAIEPVDGQHDVGRVRRGRRPVGAERDADVGHGQGGRIVDAVAHHHRHPVLAFGTDGGGLLLGACVRRAPRRLRRPRRRPRPPGRDRHWPSPAAGSPTVAAHGGCGWRLVAAGPPARAPRPACRRPPRRRSAHRRSGPGGATVAPSPAPPPGPATRAGRVGLGAPRRCRPSPGPPPRGRRRATARTMPPARAAATTDEARTWGEACSTDAARPSSSSGRRRRPRPLRPATGRPTVTVPVLSNTSTSAWASCSSTPPPLTIAPRCAARDSPEVMATGTARMRGQGVATTSTATARSKLPDTSHPAAAMTRATGTNHSANRSARRTNGAVSARADSTSRTIPA